MTNNMYYYAILVKKKENIPADYPNETRDECGVNYGLYSIRDQDRWKLGDPDTYAMGYFKSKSDAEELKKQLDKDRDVNSGAIEIVVKEYEKNVLEIYPNSIILDRVYPELCINGFSETLPPMTLTEALKFYE